MSKKCSIEGCENKYKCKGYCEKHYLQFKRYGHILERTRNDLNEIIEYDDYAEIVLYNKQHDEIARAIIDLEYVDIVKEYRWCLCKGYAYNRKIGKLHRFIMNPSDDMVVDHINHNKLDNRTSNLRICTSQQNSMNINVRCDNSSGTTGVWFSNPRNRWVAEICVNGKKIVRLFKTKEEAIEERKVLENLYFGEFSPNKED